MQSLLFPIQFAFVLVTVRSLLFFKLLKRHLFIFLWKASRGVSFFQKHLFLVALGNDGEKLRRE
jgi:hypothetical protein